MTDFVALLNRFGKEKEPFFFMIDFEMQKPVACKLDEAIENDILFDFDGQKNISSSRTSANIKLQPYHLAFTDYQQAFEKVQHEQKMGNSYLTNLTFRTPVETNKSLKDIFLSAKAKYKILYQDEFVVFSPETFITIKDQQIYSYPMKGTIDASIPDAAHVILNDDKEKAEHFTIVDLIRNDLSMVSENVLVTKFRYLDLLRTSAKNLLQVSSEIRGNLPDNYRENIGNILLKLLPAGSISGAPKKKTVEIIQEAEFNQRGYYTGIAGIFDGTNLNSCVMIRYIEKNKHGLYYYSGGGITAKSEAEKEYQELKDKIYVPIY